MVPKKQLKRCAGDRHMAAQALNMARNCLHTTIVAGCGSILMLTAGKAVQFIPGASLAGSIFARSACVFLAGTAALGRQVVVHIEEAGEYADENLIQEACRTIKYLFLATITSMVLQRNDLASLAVLAGSAAVTIESYLHLRRIDR